ncbi:MAG TPA: OmpA family protein [Pseudomonadota bacterium]|nr:OmpA family protein [Pseudomonadota bacterium]
MPSLRRVLPLALLFAVSACGIPKEQWEQKLRENADLQSKVNDLEGQKTKLQHEIADLTKERDDLQRAINALKGDMSKSDREKADLIEKLAKMNKTLEDLQRAQEAAEKRAKAFRDLVAKFKAMVDAGKLQVEVRNGLMIVKLPDNILFDPGKTDLKKEGQDAIVQVTNILNGIEGRKFQVAGHTDNKPIKSGKFRDNWELSAQRALTVTDLMIKTGLDARRLSAAGYADVLPVATNDTDDGRRQNRRIEIVLVPNLEDLPSINDKN